MSAEKGVLLVKLTVIVYKTPHSGQNNTNYRGIAGEY